MGIDGSDTISGLGGDDLLDGGPGTDYLIGGAGADQLVGGAGVDRFQFDTASDSAVGAADTIWDFVRSQGDKIHLSGVDANSLVAGDQAFTFISTSAFSGAAGELRYVRSGGNTSIYGDLDGDAVADFQININGEHTLVSSDFVL
jgi:Ca2+-binding RTX toxin-like protein